MQVILRALPKDKSASFWAPVAITKILALRRRDGRVDGFVVNGIKGTPQILFQGSLLRVSQLNSMCC